MIAIIPLTAFLIWLYHQDTKNAGPAAPPTKQEMINAQFSPLDGSNRPLTRYIKERMNDPGSYEHVETRYWDRGDHIIVVTSFRGKNAFGGLVLNSVTAKMGLDGTILEVSQ